MDKNFIASINTFFKGRLGRFLYYWAIFLTIVFPLGYLLTYHPMYPMSEVKIKVHFLGTVVGILILLVKIVSNYFAATEKEDL